VMENGKAAEAVAVDRKEDLPVEARCHVRNFHVLFFTLDPDMKTILAGVGQAFYLADGSAKRLFDNLREAGYYAGIVAGNFSQSIRVDSVRVDIGRYPYRFKCYATEKIIRPTTITTRVLVTEGRLRNSARSDNNGFGFLIEGLEVLDNRDVLVQNREL
jgi:conjugative transposon TraK protein